MANLKNAEKAILVNGKKRVSNNDFKQAMKTAIKNVERAVAAKDKDKALDKLKIAIKAIDKASEKGVAAKNTCARNKSRLTKKVNSME